MGSVLLRRRVRIRYFADIRFPLERANGVQTMETCHALARRGHQVTLVVRPDSHTPPRGPFAYYGLPAIPSLTINCVRVPSALSARRAGYVAHALLGAIGRSAADIIVTRDLTIASLLLRVPAAFRPPVAYESHGFAPAVSAEGPSLHTGAAASSRAKQRRLARRERYVWRRADAYVTITAGLLAELTRRFGPRPSAGVVPDGTRVPAQAPAPRSRRHDPGVDAVVAYAGHLYPWKGIDLLIEALSKLPTCRGLVVGGLDGEPDVHRVRTLADALAPGRVTFAGMVEPPMVASLLARADVLVLPNLPTRISSAYTSPLKLFEYMASGRPIVASDLPALREVLRPDSNAVLVEPGNADALAEGIRRITGDHALGDRLAAQAWTDVAAYSWDARAERLEALLAEGARA